MPNIKRYRIWTNRGDDASKPAMIVDCDEETAKQLLPIFVADAPNLTECRELHADGTFSSRCIVTFGPKPEGFDPHGPGTPAWLAFDAAEEAVRAMLAELPDELRVAWLKRLTEVAQQRADD